MRKTLIAATVFLLLAISSHAAEKEVPQVFSDRQETTITIHPGGAMFMIPDAWLTSFQSYHNNLNLTREELAKVKDGMGEWDTQYGGIANAILPFDRCAFHGGGEGWGSNGATFGDLQMRVYVGDWSLPAISDRVSSAGLSLVKRLPNLARRSEPAYQKRTAGPWQVDSLTFSMVFIDYGATAMMDYYSQKRQDSTLTLVFMYTNYSDLPKQEIKHVIESLRFSEAKPAKKEDQQKGPANAKKSPR